MASPPLWEPKASLLGPNATGGKAALDGFDFQREVHNAELIAFDITESSTE